MTERNITNGSSPTRKKRAKLTRIVRRDNNMGYQRRINAALGKILINYNLLEYNLGLCLRWLENPKKPSTSHKYLKKAGVPKIILRLKEKLDECEHVPDISEFEEWILRAEKIRHLRNYYVHATWEYLPLREKAPLEFIIPPWLTETINGNDQGAMRIEDLEADADRVEKVFNDFIKIRKKYGV